jgi:addiction module RelB/DinJ family antitoxin
MSTTIVNIKTDPKLKQEAQELASKLGLSLSSVLNEYLKRFVQDRTITFSEDEEPSDYLIRSIKQAEEDIKKGDVSPSFDSAEDAIAWLDDPDRKYENQI